MPCGNPARKVAADGNGDSRRRADRDSERLAPADPPQALMGAPGDLDGDGARKAILDGNGFEATRARGRDGGGRGGRPRRWPRRRAADGVSR